MMFNYIKNGGPDPYLYNCSAKTVEEWYATGKPNIPIGTYFLATGITYEILYIFCLIAIAQRDLLKNSCYKLMLVLGLIDCCCITINSIITGYLTLVGAVFCTHPTLIYIVGSFGTGLWCAACAACVLLAINRCCDMTDKAILKEIFVGKRVYMICMIPFVYFLLIFMLTPPILYNSNYIAWFFDPFVYENKSEQYMNIPHTINNFVVVFLTTSLYGYLSLMIQYKNRHGGQSASSSQKLIFLQSLMICGFNGIAAYIYVIMQFVPISNFIVLLGQIAWQSSHGCVCLIYIIMNKSIRNSVVRMICPSKIARQLGVATVSRQQWTAPPIVPIFSGAVKF